MKTVGAFATMKGFASPFSKLHFMSSYVATYAAKAAAPMKKSSKVNIVEAQMNNRSRWAIPKVLQRQHRGAQVARKCVSPPPVSHGGEALSAWFTHLYVLCCPILWADLACYPHDILYHITLLLLINNASFISYFVWGRAIIWMRIWSLTAATSQVEMDWTRSFCPFFSFFQNKIKSVIHFPSKFFAEFGDLSNEFY